MLYLIANDSVRTSPDPLALYYSNAIRTLPLASSPNVSFRPRGS